MKILFIAFSLFFSTLLFGQNQIKEIISLNNLDTVFIKRFDTNQNLIFHKIFPQYGTSQILIYDYEENKLSKYIWSHSKFGFIIDEYKYSDNQMVTIEYSQEDNLKIPNLMTYYSRYELMHSPEYQEIYIKKNKHIKSVSYLENNLIKKEVIFNRSKDTTDIIDYTYKNGLLIEKKDNYYGKNAFNKLVYTYDINGKELSWIKIFSPNDTSYIYKSRYDNELLIEQIGYEKGKVSSKEIYKYKKEKLISQNRFNKNNELKINSEYKYDKSGKLIQIEKVNRYMGISEIIKYYYY